ncbi:hypothetical protein G7Y79_00077g099830 [Physcia stellaris]|nr:hypothetical protein G7Y79_00077g099830 [Physcia stellaris]
MNAYPPPPNAPPTPAYTPMSQSSSVYPMPPQPNLQTYPPEWSGNWQPECYQSANAPPTPVYSPYTPYSPTRKEECRNQASCQASINLFSTFQYISAAYGFGGSVPQAPGRYETSYFPQQQQHSSQSPQTQPAPSNPILAPAYGQNQTVTRHYVTDSVQLDLSKLSLNEPQPALIPTAQYPSPAQTQSSKPTSTADQPRNASHAKTELQHEYTPPSPSKIYPQTSHYGLQQPQYAQAQIQQFQQVQSYQQVQSSYGQEAPPGILAHKPGKDDQQTGKVTRFLGDTLVGRFARSSVSTVTTTLKMPAVLSPWGDNNPVTLPNVRYRDAALFGTFAIIGAPLVDGMSDVVTNSFGAEHFISDVVSSGAGFITGNTIVKYGVFQIVEQAIDKGVLEHVLPEVEKTMRTTTAKTLQVSIKHKLMGVEADIRMHGPYPTSNSMACEKGWFAPYLFASSRTPVIRRSEDFAIAQFFKPYLIADTHLTHKLLTESASVIPLCDPSPSARLPHARLLVTFIGISPFRGEGSGMWSTSRRPGCGQLRIHMLNGCPTLVVPAASDTQRTPVIAWSPWTLKQMQEGIGRTGTGAQGQYTPQKQHQEICGWLLGMVERSALHPSVSGNAGSLERVVARVVTMIINGALMTSKGKKIYGVVNCDRTKIVIMRY